MSYFSRLAAMVHGGRVSTDHGASIVEQHEVLEQRDVVDQHAVVPRHEVQREVVERRVVAPVPSEAREREEVSSQPRAFPPPPRQAAPLAPVVIEAAVRAPDAVVIREQAPRSLPATPAAITRSEIVHVSTVVAAEPSAPPPRVVAPEPRPRPAARRDAPGLEVVSEVLRWVGEPVTPPAPASRAAVEPVPSLDVSIGAIEIAIEAPPPPAPRVRAERAPAPARRSRIRDTRLARRLPRLPGGG